MPNPMTRVLKLPARASRSRQSPPVSMPNPMTRVLKYGKLIDPNGAVIVVSMPNPMTRVLKCHMRAAMYGI